jgi:hypothetical protein
MRRQDVVVTVITDVDDLGPLAGSELRHLVEEPRSWFGHTPLTGGGDRIDG